MKSIRHLWVAGLLAMAVVIGTPAPSSASSIMMSVTYRDVTTNIGQVEPPYDINTAIEAQLMALQYGCPDDCWKAFVYIPFLFSYDAVIDLPQLGATIDGGFVDATFRATTLTHETWHYNYIEALANATYGALQTWSAGYVGCCFLTEDAALAAGQFDMVRALGVARDAYNADINSDVDKFEKQLDANGQWDGQSWNTYARRELIDGVLTWRSVNPDWGQGAINYANNVHVSFEVSPGDPECPEPSTWVLVGTVIVGIAAERWRRRT